MNSLDGLSEEAKIAYQSFLDMTKSKDAHFSCLEAITTKYEAGGAPSLAENLELEKLLANHDKNVKAFKTAFTAVTNAGEKQTVIQLMS